MHAIKLRTKSCPSLALGKRFVLDPCNGPLGSVDKIIIMRKVPNKNQRVSIIAIFKMKKLYSPWIFRSPNPTLNPVNVKAHIIPATVNISFAILIV